MIAQRQMIQHGAGEARKGFLVAQGRGQLVEISPGLGLDHRPPQIDRGGKRSRRLLTGQLLAHHQPQHIGQGRFVPHPRLAHATAQEPVFQAGSQIAGDAFHGQRTNRFNAGLFGGLESRRPVGRGRAQLIVDLLVVIGLAQGIGIAGAAHQSDVLGRQIAMGRGQARLQTLERRRLAGEIDFQLWLGRQRTHRDRDGTLEWLCGGFRFGHL